MRRYVIKEICSCQGLAARECFLPTIIVKLQREVAPLNGFEFPEAALWASRPAKPQANDRIQASTVTSGRLLRGVIGGAGGAPLRFRPVRCKGLDGADVLGEPGVTEYLTNGLDLADVVPVVVRHPSHGRPDGLADGLAVEQKIALERFGGQE